MIRIKIQFPAELENKWQFVLVIYRQLYLLQPLSTNSPWPAGDELKSTRTFVADKTKSF